MRKNAVNGIHEMNENEEIKMKENGQKKSIAILGAGNLDVLAAPVNPSVFEKRTLPVEAISLSFGGDALNEACVLAALGARVKFVTLLGTDMASTLVRNFVREQNIELQEVKSEAPAGINIVLVEEDQERCFITNPHTSMRKLALSNIPEIDADIVCLASLFVSYDLPIEDAAFLMKNWKEQGKITCADTTTAKRGEGLQDMAKFLPYVDYFFTNEREAASFTGLVRPEEMLAALQKAGAHSVLLKLGKKGVMVLHENQISFSPVIANPGAVDTTGCGDSFAAGFLYGLSHDFDFSSCLQLAKNCGSLACENLGATEVFRSMDQKDLHVRLGLDRLSACGE